MSFCRFASYVIVSRLEYSHHSIANTFIQCSCLVLWYE